MNIFCAMNSHSDYQTVIKFKDFLLSKAVNQDVLSSKLKAAIGHCNLAKIQKYPFLKSKRQHD